MSWLRNLFSKKRAPLHDRAIRRYLDKFSNPMNRNEPIENLTFSVLDLESTSLSNKSKILSIGVIKCSFNTIWPGKSLELYLHQQKEHFNPLTSAIHGIIPGDINTVGEREALLILLDFIQGDVCVAHNISVDRGMLNRALVSHFNIKLKNHWIDTFMLARRIDNPNLNYEVHNSGEYSLDSLTERYNIKIEDRHTAAGDALGTAELLVRQLSELKKRGVVRWGQLKAR